MAKRQIVETLDADDEAAAARIGDDFDAESHYAGVEPTLRPIFAAPVESDAVTGDTLLDRPPAE